ncbi:MAG: 50S ribosomal protein L25 [Parcubacteria group bacterium]|nr:50S ribosomal protein L25 [Parcubacteria group bacterium]
MFTLATEKRDAKKGLAKLRKEGRMPAVFYGSKTTSKPVSVSTKDFQKIWHEAGESSVIALETTEGKLDILIHEVTLDPVRGEPIHADFYVIDAKKKVTVTVPIVFEGVSPAVKDLGGTLVKVMYEMEIEVLPKHLPHEIKVDISTLKDFDSQISIKDIALPESAVATDNPEEVVAMITQKVEEKEEAPAPIDLSAIEVEKKGKKEEEGSEAAPSETKA